MHLAFLPIRSSNLPTSPEILVHFPGLEVVLECVHREYFLVRCEPDEVAYLQIESTLDANCLLVYMIFVRSGFRQRGIGAEVMLWAIDYATGKGYHRLQVRPVPMSAYLDIDMPVLQAFYHKLGFFDALGYPGLLEVVLSPNAPQL